MHAGIGYAKCVQPRHGILAAQFDDLQLSNNGISFRYLVQPEEPVGDGKDRIVAQFVFSIFTDQEGCRLPTGQEQRQSLNEGLQVHVTPRLAHHGSEGVHNHDRGIGLFNFPGDFLQDRAQVIVQDSLAQVDKTDGVRQLVWIEECVLLLVSQHLDRGFAEDSKVESRTFRGGIGKHKLVRQRGLAASGGAREDIEGKLGQAAADNLV